MISCSLLLGNIFIGSNLGYDGNATSVVELHTVAELHTAVDIVGLHIHIADAWHTVVEWHIVAGIVEWQFVVRCSTVDIAEKHTDCIGLCYAVVGTLKMTAVQCHGTGCPNKADTTGVLMWMAC